MLDTISVSIVDFHTDKVCKENGWKVSADEPFVPYKKIKLKNGASVFMKYFLFSRSLVLTFSASKIQHGTNAIAYNFNRSGEVEHIIENTVKDELGVVVTTKQMNICRLDLNCDLVYENEDRANAAMDFANKIVPARYERRFDYETGLTSQTKKGNGFRVYRKDKDTHLKKAEREEMDPTVRFEFQMNRKAATKTFGYRPNLHQVLTNRVAVEFAWNKLLTLYGLDEDIVTRDELHQIAVANISQPSLRETLKQMNDEPSFTDKKQRQKQLAVTRKCKSIGVCPYSCETPITIKKRVCDTIIGLRKVNRIWNNTANKHPYKSRTIVRDIPRNTKWYLDSS